MTNEEAIVHLEYRKDFATQAQIEALDMAIEALKRIPDGATNGDVIKALFKDRNLSIIQERLEHTHWWNAPYKEGEGE